MGADVGNLQVMDAETYGTYILMSSNYSAITGYKVDV